MEGATHALRQAKEGELQGDRVKEVTVELAAGTAQLWQQKDIAVAREGRADRAAGRAG